MVDIGTTDSYEDLTSMDGPPMRLRTISSIDDEAMFRRSRSNSNRFSISSDRSDSLSKSPRDDLTLLGSASKHDYDSESHRRWGQR